MKNSIKIRRGIKEYRIYWYKLIPFVIAEIENPEWNKLESMDLPVLKSIYNSDGGWYILEGLDYFWFSKEWWTNKGEQRLFNDSMFYDFNDKTDEKKYLMLLEYAREDINRIWKSLLGKLSFWRNK